MTVGGSGVGGGLLTRLVESFPESKRLVPELRMIVVCGPRIDPDSLPTVDGLEVVSYVHELSRHLAACDVAVVQGGPDDLHGARRRPDAVPLLPLRRHCEQQLHVRYRLERYGAGRALHFDTATPDSIAAEIALALTDHPTPAPVERDGAARRRLIASLL